MPKAKKEEKKEVYAVKCVVIDNKEIPGWNIGDGVEVMSDDWRIEKGYLKEVEKI